MQFLCRPDEGSPEWVGEKKGRGDEGVGCGGLRVRHPSDNEII